MTFVILVLGVIIGFLGGLVCGIIIMIKVDEDVHNQIEDEMKYFHRLAEKAKEKNWR